MHSRRQKAAQELASIATQLSGLMRQFKIERSDRRIDISLPVKVSASDVNGQPVNQEIMTINISRHGAFLTGIRGKLRLNSQVSLSRLNKREQISQSCG